MKTRSIESFHEVEVIPANLDALSSNEVQKLKISKSVGKRGFSETKTDE